VIHTLIQYVEDPETGEEDIEVEVVVHYSPGSPGRLSGPPERCYPPEPPEVEVAIAKRTDTGVVVPPGWLDYDAMEQAICDEIAGEKEYDAEMRAEAQREQWLEEYGK